MRSRLEYKRENIELFMRSRTNILEPKVVAEIGNCLELPEA